LIIQNEPIYVCMKYQ